jgi:hypothetical protein
MAAAAVPIIATGVSALAGWLANRKKQTQQTQSQTQNINTFNMPEYDEKTATLRDRLINEYMSGYENNDDLFGGYQAEGLKNINQSSDSAMRALESMLSQRGIRRTGMAATALTGNVMNRLNQQSSFLNNIPLLRDELRRKKLGEAANLFGMIPKGSRQTGTVSSTGTGTFTDPGNPLGGAVGNLGTTLAGLYGMGAFGDGGSNIGYNPSDTAYNLSMPNSNYGQSQNYFDPKKYSLFR